MKTWLCPVCMQGEAVAKDAHKQKSGGIKMSLEPTAFHPTLSPRIK